MSEDVRTWTEWAVVDEDGEIEVIYSQRNGHTLQDAVDFYAPNYGDTIVSRTATCTYSEWKDVQP